MSIQEIRWISQENCRYTLAASPKEFDREAPFLSIVDIPDSRTVSATHWNLLPFLGGFLACVFIPTLIVAFAGIEESPPLSYLLESIFMFAAIFNLMAVTYSATEDRKLRLLAGIGAASYYLIIIILRLYELYMGDLFDITFVTNSLRDVIPTLLNMFGPLLIGTTILFLMAVWAGYFSLWSAIMLKKRKLKMAHRIVLLVSLALIGFVFHEDLFAGSGLIPTEVKSVSAYFPEYGVSAPLSGENVFMLQLETGNALALEGYSKYGNYKGNYFPNIKAYTKKYGLFFPLFWENTVMTNRAQESILCGIVGNIKGGLSFYPEKIQTPCLPKLLAQNGYKTIVFRSDRLTFANEGNFFKAIGFEEVHYDDIMKLGDKKYPWGFDEPLFYKRAFEYLKAKYPDHKKLFVYIEVSSHHPDFYPQKLYEFTHAFSEPANYLEKYFNGYREQDFGVGKFAEEYEKYAPGNSHLFIFPDHSYPMPILESGQRVHTAISPNFLGHLSYIPPRERASEFRIGDTESLRFSQANLLPTVLELLERRPVKESFAFALRKEGQRNLDEEDCQLVTETYRGPEFGVIKDQRYFYRYSFPEQTVSYIDLLNDLISEHPLIIRKNVSSTEFNEKYNCKKYRSIIPAESNTEK